MSRTINLKRNRIDLICTSHSAGNQIDGLPAVVVPVRDEYSQNCPSAFSYFSSLLLFEYFSNCVSLESFILYIILMLQSMNTS